MKFHIPAFLILVTVSSSCLRPDSNPAPKTEVAGKGKVAFRSTDGGKTWQDISEGLPENSGQVGGPENGFYADEQGLSFKVGKELYHSTPDATAQYWTKETFPEGDSSIVRARSVASVYKYWGIRVKRPDGTSVWSPIFELFQEPRTRCVFETAGGAIFIGTDRGLFKTTDHGGTWKQVYSGGLVGNLAESDGVLLSTSMQKVIRSTDEGESWSVVSNEGYKAFDVKQTQAGFAAITSSKASDTRRARVSHDGGKTWQPIDAGLSDKAVIDSIWKDGNVGLRARSSMSRVIPVGETLYSSHPDGIFKSSDKGKTWELIFPSVIDRAFSLFVSGNVLYAVASKGGC